MKLLKFVLLSIFIGIITISCQDAKKKELNETEVTTEDEAEVTEVETTTEEVVSEEKPATTKKSTEAKEVEAEHKSKPEIKEVKSTKVTEVETNEEEIILEKLADSPVVYPGCSGTNDEVRACSIQEFTKFFTENFNVEITKDLELEAGVHNMRALLKVDKSGKVSVKEFYSDEKKLEEEFNRVITMCPTMTPAVSKGKPVNVQFVLPVKFEVAGF